MPFNPFDRPLGESLTPADLRQLVARGVAEGYHVEYKRELPAKEKIGRSIASLANTYGGWYIVGVETDEHNVAINGAGFDPATDPDPIARVRDIAKTHIDPVPVFYPQVVTLDTGNIALVVYVPDQQETPFITKDGRIYRRNHDSSDPVPEASRYAIDRLVDQGRAASARFARFCRDERTFSKAEAGQGWVQFYLAPYPPGLLDRRDRPPDLERLAHLLEASRRPIKLAIPGIEPDAHPTGAVPFTGGQTGHGAFILRNSAPSGTIFNTLTVELFDDGRAKLFIPLRRVPVWQEPARLTSPGVREVLAAHRAADEENFHALTFLDIEELWTLTAILVSAYEEDLRARLPAGVWPVDMRVSARIEGAWRAVPFFDDEHWAEHARRFGLPVVGHDSIDIPEDIGRGVLLRGDGGLGLFLLLGGLVNRALGLPGEVHALGLVRALSPGERNRR